MVCVVPELIVEFTPTDRKSFTRLNQQQKTTKSRSSFIMPNTSTFSGQKSNYGSKVTDTRCAKGSSECLTNAPQTSLFAIGMFVYHRRVALRF